MDLPKKISHQATGENIIDTRFRLTIPDSEDCDLSNLNHACKNAASLTKTQLRCLKSLARFISIFRFAYFPINAKILPTFYDLGLFTGSTYLWCGAYKRILLKDRHKYKDLDLDLTLVLLTALLAGSDDGLGAGRWYKMGITRKTLKHLIKLIETEQKRGEK